MKNDLSCFSILSGLSDEELCLLQTHLKRGELNAGTQILTKGYTGSGLFFLQKGSVKVFIPGRNHSENSYDEVILTLCGPGEILGEIDLFDGAGHTASVVTLEPASLLWMSTETFRQCQKRIPRLAKNLSCTVAARTRYSTEVQRALSVLQLPGKIAYRLLLLAKRYGISQQEGSILLPLRITQEEIAGLVGSSRVCVSRVMSPFVRRGYIVPQPGKRLLIRDTRALEQLCEGWTLEQPVPIPASFNPLRMLLE